MCINRIPVRSLISSTDGQMRKLMNQIENASRHSDSDLGNSSDSSGISSGISSGVSTSSDVTGPMSDGNVTPTPPSPPDISVCIATTTI